MENEAPVTNETSISGIKDQENTEQSNDPSQIFLTKVESKEKTIKQAENIENNNYEDNEKQSEENLSNQQDSVSVIPENSSNQETSNESQETTQVAIDNNDDSIKISVNITENETTDSTNEEEEEHKESEREYKYHNEYPQMTEEDILTSDQAVTNFIKHGIIPNATQRQNVAQYLKRMQVDSMVEGNYKQADHYYKVCNNFIQACKTARDPVADNNRKMQMKEEVFQLQDKMDDINKQFDGEIETVQSKGRDELTKIETKHEDDVKQFVQKWENEDALLAFSKPSFQLQELRRKEKQAILSKNFEIAAKLKQEADELEVQETKKAQNLAQQTLEDERYDIEEHFNKQKDSLDKSIAYKVNKLEMKRSQALHPIKCRIKKLENDIKNFNSAPPKESVFDIEARNINQPTILFSPRTRQRMSQFKLKPKCKKLPMQSISCFSRPVKITVPRL